MKYKYQENFAQNFEERVKEEYKKENRELKAKKIVKVIERYIDENSKYSLSEMKALDIGCSVGYITAFMAPFVSEIIGTDIDEYAINIAKKNNKNISNLQYMVADSMALPFSDNTFDLVICTQVYEHVPDSTQLMKEIKRVLKPEGICYFAATQRFVLIEPHYKLPFLSWFPKRISNFYLKITKRGNEYYENLLSYRNLKKMVREFKIYDYTIDVIKNPRNYDAAYIKSNKFVSLMLNIPFIKYILPGYLWILKK